MEKIVVEKLQHVQSFLVEAFLDANLSMLDQPPPAQQGFDNITFRLVIGVGEDVLADKVLEPSRVPPIAYVDEKLVFIHQNPLPITFWQLEGDATSSKITEVFQHARLHSRLGLEIRHLFSMTGFNTMEQRFPFIEEATIDFPIETCA